MYEKPDVEITQEFRNTSPIVNSALMQSVIIGPAYQRIKDFNDPESQGIFLGEYTKKEFEANMPELTPNAEIQSIQVYIQNYAGDHEVPESVIKVGGNSGRIETDPVEGFKFSDSTRDFTDIVAANAEEGIKGDYVCAIIDGVNHYFEVVKKAEDVKAVYIADEESFLASASLPLEGLEYTSGNAGYIYKEKNEYHKQASILVTPFVSDNGKVIVSGRAMRKDLCDKPFYASSIEELEQIFGAGEVDLSNPLAYGMFKALAYLGADDAIAGIMVETDDPVGYQKAFDALESEEVYCMVPLTHDPIVHQMLKEHVDVMSSPKEKRERVAVVVSGVQNRAVKAGFFGAKNEETGYYDMASGSVSYTGILPSNASNMATTEEALPGTPNVAVDTQGAFSRCCVRFESTNVANLKVSYYTTETAEEEPAEQGIAVIADNEAGTTGYVMLNSKKPITFVKYTTVGLSSEGESCKVYGIDSVDAEASADSTFIYPEFSLKKAGQKQEFVLSKNKGFFIRRMKVDAADAHYNPFAVMVYFKDGGKLNYSITEEGYYNFGGREATKIEVSTAYVEGSYDFIEIEVSVKESSYSVNKIVDKNATFLSNKIVPGKDEFVVINRFIEDAETDSGFKETVYRVSEVISEHELTVDAVYDKVLSRFVPASFSKVGLKYEYRVQTPIITNKRVLAQWYADISRGFGDRRVTHLMAPVVTVEGKNGQTIAIPGYYLACAYAGATQSELPQQGFTNKSFAGFTGVMYTSSYFKNSELNTIAEGGTAIAIQEGPKSPISIRHQLTTDMTSKKTREYSITRCLDYMAKTARLSFRPYIGKYNVNAAMLTVLYQLGGSCVSMWLDKGVALTGTSVDRFYQDEKDPDTVYACFKINVPFPLNYIKLTFVI